MPLGCTACIRQYATLIDSMVDQSALKNRALSTIVCISSGLCYSIPRSLVITDMKGIFSGVIALVAVGGLVAVVTTHVGAATSVYTPSALRAGITRNPSAWVGRTVLVRGLVVGCGPWMHCPIRQMGTPPLALADSATAPPSQALPLQWGSQDDMLAALRRLPFVGRWIPRPQTAHWGTTALYRVRLQALPATACGVQRRSAPCDGAALLDSTPPLWRPPRFTSGAVIRPLPLWRGTAHVSPVPVRPWQGPTRVQPLPYSGQSAGQQ